ncbi:MAG: hypothetical protein AABY22_31070, partial [Nanoarchaeota archaeon]
SREAYLTIINKSRSKYNNKKTRIDEHEFASKKEINSIKIIIQHLQPTLNRLLRIHWTKFQKEQEIFNTFVNKYYVENYNGENFRGRKVKIIHTLYFKDRKKRDLSNYGQKMMDDSLVREGIIDDDNSSIIIEESVKIRYDSNYPRTETLIQKICNNKT